MAKRKSSLRYVVDGPGLEHEITFADPGTALSRSVTAASVSKIDGTWYVRDSITKDVLGYSERQDEGKIIVTVRHD